MSVYLIANHPSLFLEITSKGETSSQLSSVVAFPIDPTQFDTLQQVQCCSS